MSAHWRPPVVSVRAWRLVARNFLVWRRLMVPSLMIHLVEPAVFFIGFGYGVGALVGDVDGGSYLSFLAAGMAGYAVMNSASFEALYSAFTRMHVQRNWESILHAPMTVDDVVAGEWLWAGCKSTLAGAAMLAIISLVGLANWPSALLLIPSLLLGGLAFAAIALVFNALARSYEFFSFYFSLFIAPMMILSGAFFPVDRLPEALQTLSAVLPLRHVVDMARPLLAGETPPDWQLNIAVLLAYTAVGLWLATSLTRRRFMA